MTIAIATQGPDEAMAGRAGLAAANLARTVGDLVVTGSLELGAHRPDDAHDIAELLPAGTPVFINHLPRHTLDDTLRGVLAVARAGLTPVPHIAARRVDGSRALADFLARAAGEGGVRKVLVLGGDKADATGPYGDAQSLLDSGQLEAAGIREVAFAAYPEGHPRIATPVLTAALDRKLASAKAKGLGASVVTQFSFNPSRIVEFAVDLQRRAPSVPVWAGVPGPTNPASLIRFAQACGVSASLRALSQQGFAAARLVTHTDPGEQLSAIARHISAGATTNIVGVHIYTFGGVRRAAQWMNSVIRSR